MKRYRNVGVRERYFASLLLHALPLFFHLNDVVMKYIFIL